MDEMFEDFLKHVSAAGAECEKRASGIFKKLAEKGYFSEEQAPMTMGALVILGRFAERIIEIKSESKRADLIKELLSRGRFN